MSTITMSTTDLRKIVRTSVREGIQAEIMNIRALALPYVSKGEQREIEKLYKNPSKNISKSHFVKI